MLAQPDGAAGEPSPAVAKVLADEAAAGLHTVEGHDGFAGAVLDVKRDLLQFLVDASRRGLSVAGYGAPGKGNTLLNHCGIRPDLLPFTVDRNPHKQGLFLPGTHIPIHAPERLARGQARLRAGPAVEPAGRRSSAQLSYVREWGGRFVVPIPQSRRRLRREETP